VEIIAFDRFQRYSRKSYPLYPSEFLTVYLNDSGSAEKKQSISFSISHLDYFLSQIAFDAS